MTEIATSENPKAILFDGEPLAHWYIDGDFLVVKTVSGLFDQEPIVPLSSLDELELQAAIMARALLDQQSP
ncbi:hypothetical protein [Gluconobacter sp. Gdi]|uniref:hypothetical protein n=1 Tax=Gluconobacter sp. Gdi TaxID=2691888 RepID=UPI00176D92FC|nr:hypothetical protein [Gluconobacter sp. Gdi]GFE96560.1 hypothetical protein DmGdi_16330 [Gluconobacter sp. Gdi]